MGHKVADTQGWILAHSLPYGNSREDASLWDFMQTRIWIFEKNLMLIRIIKYIQVLHMERSVNSFFYSEIPVSSIIFKQHFSSDFYAWDGYREKTDFWHTLQYLKFHFYFKTERQSCHIPVSKIANSCLYPDIYIITSFILVLGAQHNVTT